MARRTSRNKSAPFYSDPTAQPDFVPSEGQRVCVALMCGRKESDIERVVGPVSSVRRYGEYTKISVITEERPLSLLWSKGRWRLGGMSRFYYSIEVAPDCRTRKKAET